MRTIVDVVPAPLLVFAAIGAVVGIVLLSGWAVRRWLPATREGLDAEVSSQVLGVVASLVGLLLAFVVVILGYVTLVGSWSSAFHAVGAGAIAVIVGLSLVVLVTLQFPFSGGLAVDPTPFKEGGLAQFFAPSR